MFTWFNYGLVTIRDTLIVQVAQIGESTNGVWEVSKLGGTTLDLTYFDAPPSSLMDSIVSPKVKIVEGEGVGARSQACNTLGVEGRAGIQKWGLGKLTSNSITYKDLHKPNKLVSAYLEQFGA